MEMGLVIHGFHIHVMDLTCILLFSILMPMVWMITTKFYLELYLTIPTLMEMASATVFRLSGRKCRTP